MKAACHQARARVLRARACAATLTLFALAGCGVGPSAHPVTSATQAVAIAHDLARGTPAGHGPFHAQMSDGNWRVTSGAAPGLWVITIDAKTGRARTGFHPAVTPGAPAR